MHGAVLVGKVEVPRICGMCGTRARKGLGAASRGEAIRRAQECQPEAMCEVRPKRGSAKQQQRSYKAGMELPARRARMFIVALFILATSCAADAVVERTTIQTVVAASAYNEERFGSWSLRSDPNAQTFYSSLSGVIELSSKSTDGKIEWYFLDNGAVLQTVMRIDNCTAMAQLNYSDTPGAESPADDYIAEVRAGKVCNPGPHQSEIGALAASLPAAIDAMKQRAKVMFPQAIERCITRPVDPLAPPLHPQCGFGASRIGEKGVF